MRTLSGVRAVGKGPIRRSSFARTNLRCLELRHGSNSHLFALACGKLPPAEAMEPGRSIFGGASASSEDVEIGAMGDADRGEQHDLENATKHYCTEYKILCTINE